MEARSSAAAAVKEMHTDGLIHLPTLEDILQREYNSVKKDKNKRLEDILGHLGCLLQEGVAKTGLGWDMRTHTVIFNLHWNSPDFKGGKVNVHSTTVSYFINGWKAGTSGSPLYYAFVMAKGNPQLLLFKDDPTAMAEKLLKTGVAAAIIET